MELYLVSEGDYADYRVIGIFNSHEQAEVVRRKYDSHNGGYSRIEKFELDKEEKK